METHNAQDKRIVVIGAGPAGLTAAHDLAKLGIRPIVLEKYDKVGGLARTETYKGFHFDLGGHRFFTKVKEVELFWHDVLKDDFLQRPRLSRIYYNGRYFDYPLKPLNVLRKLGILESMRIIASYVRWQLLPYAQEETFEQWVTNRFGQRLFLNFFKTYTEKVWGIPCSELKAEWAAQRIKDLSLKTAVLNMFIKPRKTIKTLIESFEYPRLGPGMLWSAVRRQVEARGGVVRLSCDVTRICRQGNRIESVVFASNGCSESIAADGFISSMPLTEFIKKLDPPSPPHVCQAADRLNYRDFLTVCLIINKEHLFPDNWIYIHDPTVKVGRIQNFKNWSRSMVPDPTKTSLGLEYFCTEGDDLWLTSDTDLVELAKRELERVGLARYSDVESGCVFRVPKSYPVYDSEYRDALATLRSFVETLDNFQTIGRNGLHRYNNQDHSMLTGMLAVRNLAFAERNNLWSINTEQDYHEQVTAESQVLAPLEGLLHRVFLKLDRVALGISLGTVIGMALFIATILLVLRGGEPIGPTLRLLGQYFPGYAVTGSGSLLGFLYGFVAGFAGGWILAFTRNSALFLYMVVIRRRANLNLLRRALDYV